MGFDTGEVRSLIHANLGRHGIPERGGGITDVEIDLIISEAASRYGSFFPRVGVYDISGNGTDYDFTLPTDWDDAISSILSVEYPQGTRTPQLLDPLSVILYEKPTGTFIRFLTTVPASSETARVLYALPHIISEDAADTTVPDSHKEAVAHLATSLYALRLAAEASKIVLANIQNDPLGGRSGVANTLLQLAKQHWAAFASLTGIPEEGSQVPATSGVVSLSTIMSWGRPPVTHGRDVARLWSR